MSLAHKIDEWYKEKEIKLSFDPNKSSYMAWFGREIPVIFDGDTSIGDAAFDPKTKTIHLNENYAVKSSAKYLLHECGHANFNTGKSTLTDWTMLPSLYLSFEYFKAILNESQEQGQELVGYFTIGLLGLIVPLVFRYGISELLAEGYKTVKVLQPKIKRLIKSY